MAQPGTSFAPIDLYHSRETPFFTSKTPFFTKGDLGGFAIGGGQPYGPTVNLGYLVTNHLLKALGGQDLYRSPDTERIMSTLGALRSMGSGQLRTPSFGAGGQQQNLYQQELSRQVGPSQRGLTLGEPGRIQGLLQSLLRQSGINVDIEAQRLREEAAVRNYITRVIQAKGAIYGQIPLVGGLIGPLLGST